MADTSTLHHQIDPDFHIFLGRVEKHGRPEYEAKLSISPFCAMLSQVNKIVV